METFDGNFDRYMYMYLHVDTYRWYKEMEIEHAPLLESHKSLGGEVNFRGVGESQCSLSSE